MKWPELGDQLPQTRNPVTRWIGRTVFRLMGWKIEGEFPNRSKFVVALSPHTSNIDFVLTVAVLWGAGLKANFLIKDSVFWFPLGQFIRSVGGIGVDRSNPNGLVDTMVAEFAQRSSLVLGITPEGTRSGVTRWKMGFARIAAAANVPILPAVVNYKTRTVQLRALVEGLTDPEAILAAVQQASQGGVPKHQH